MIFIKRVLYVATVDIHIKSFHIPYLKMLHDNGYEVHVATNGDEKIPYCDIKHKINIERSPFKLKNIRAIKQLKKIINENKFEIIHCHTPMGGVVTRLAAKHARKKYSTKVIYTAHGFHFFKGAPILNWILFYPVEKFLSKYTDTIITINREDYERAKRKFNGKCKNIEYIPGIGIDIKKFNIKFSEEEKNEFKRTLGLKQDDYVLTCVARLDKNKNQGFLINVMEQLVKENKNTHLLLVGPDERNGYYQNIVNKKNLNKNVHFLGRREDIPKILAITDVVVSASLREGLPVNVMEALAAGKPVVALNCRGMNDLIDLYQNNYVVYNEDEMINKIKTIINKHELILEISKMNYEKSKRYDYVEIQKKMKSIYFKNKRVLHILASNSFSGAENVACTVINELSNSYDMAYCSPNGSIKEILETNNIKFFPIKTISIKEIKKVIDEYNPSIIHAHDIKASIFATFFAKRCKIISHIHKNDPYMKKISIKSFLFYIFSYRIQKIIGVSDAVFDAFIFNKKIKNKEIVLHNFVDKNEIIKKSNEFKIEKEYDAFFFGRLSAEKNPLDFIEIIHRINNKDINCVMIGDGPLYNECLKKINSYNLQNNIEIVGFQKNPFPYVKASKFGMITSLYEGFGLTAIESMILGKPVFHNGVGGLKDIFNNKLFLCSDINDYVKKYWEFINSEKQKINFNLIINKYTDKEKWVGKVSNIYNSL